MNTMSFIHSDQKKQTQALKVTSSRTTKSYHSQIIPIRLLHKLDANYIKILQLHKLDYSY